MVRATWGTIRTRRLAIHPGSWRRTWQAPGLSVRDHTGKKKMTATRAQALAELTAPGAEFALENVEIDGVPMRVYQKAPRSLRDLFQVTRAFGDKPFLIFEDEVLSFGEHLRQVSALANHLTSIGVKKGDRVAIAMRNYPEWVTSFWA